MILDCVWCEPRLPTFFVLAIVTTGVVGLVAGSIWGWVMRGLW